MKTRIILSVVFCAIGRCSPLRGKDSNDLKSPELKRLLSQYDEQVELRAEKQYREKTEALAEGYLGALKRAQEKSRAARRADEFREFQKEIDSFTENGRFAKGANATELTRLRTTYKESFSRLERDRSEALAPLDRTVLTELDRLIRLFESEGRIEDADEAIAEKRKIEAQIEGRKKAETRLTGELRVKVDIPHHSELKVRGGELWIDHTNGAGALPGLRDEPLPTYVNQEAWMPQWDGLVTNRYRLPYALPLQEFEAEVRETHGRGTIQIVEQPSQANDYTITISLKDNFNANAYTTFELKW
ncbi:MAG: hypothetical protein AAGF67_17560 [Verrucomicrobiota bacterium]